VLRREESEAEKEEVPEEEEIEEIVLLFAYHPEPLGSIFCWQQ
jgi:hypothetical protein